jgi:hypothetical protein
VEATLRPQRGLAAIIFVKVPGNFDARMSQIPLRNTDMDGFLPFYFM